MKVLRILFYLYWSFFSQFASKNFRLEPAIIILEFEQSILGPSVDKKAFFTILRSVFFSWEIVRTKTGADDVCDILIRDITYTKQILAVACRKVIEIYSVHDVERTSEAEFLYFVDIYPNLRSTETFTNVVFYNNGKFLAAGITNGQLQFRSVDAPDYEEEVRFINLSVSIYFFNFFISKFILNFAKKVNFWFTVEEKL